MERFDPKGNAVMFETKKAILFDLDGTLIDSAPDLASALNATMKALGRMPYSEETVRGWVGNGARVLVTRALSGSREITEGPDEKALKEALAIFMEAYRERICERTLLYPDVRETLKSLKKRGFTMAVVTNKPSLFVKPILEKLAIAEFFALTLGGDDLPRKKPDPMPLLSACERLETRVEETVMVGDSSNDIVAAKRAGMQSVGVTYGYNYGEEIAKQHPDAVVERFGEIAELFHG
ncbi:phosphoglycolate phosphatase [Hydrogenimonas urashimensis]|uniref:phosphoglycolate phosphatase n=1 Tax=Hydrogenimonas urashimensis TaxID=2740515 RepID=UPI0019164A73|nr:phosphoglycolate phosphatase [Hydrogenimonas urashimensis]